MRRMFEICVNIWLNDSNASCISTVKTSSSTLIISGSGYWVIDNIQDSPNIRRGVWNMAAFLLLFSAHSVLSLMHDVFI